MKHSIQIFTAALFTLLFSVGCSQQHFGVAGQTNTFGQAVSYNNALDVLWVVDNSNSMATHQADIAAQAANFLNALNSTGMDYHIGVTTMDCSSTGENGRLLTIPANTPTVLTRSTPNLFSVLQQRLQVGIGGSTVNRGLLATQEALSEPNLSGINNGFRRFDAASNTGAVLAVIYLSDKNDTSGAVANPGAFLDSVSIKDTWPDANGNLGHQWVASFIGSIPTDPTCMNVPWTREDGLAFIALANQSGGGVSSICNGDFATAVTNVQGHILSMLTQYHFTRKPDPTTIQVYINGNLVPNDPNNGWTYDGNMTLIFHGSSVPPVGSTIQVDYQPEGFNS